MRRALFLVSSTILVLIFFAFIYVFYAGGTLPPQHVVVRAIVLAQPQETVWQAVSDYSKVAAWHPVIQTVRKEAERDGKQVWTDVFVGGGEMTLIDDVVEPPNRLVRVIAGKKGAPEGSWEVVLAPVDDTHTRVTMTETAIIPSPYQRFIASKVGLDSYVTQYLISLAAHFGEEAAIKRIESPDDLAQE